MKKARQRLHAPGHEPKDLALTATKDTAKTVWAASGGSYSDYRVYALFVNQAAAEAYVDAAAGGAIWEVPTKASNEIAAMPSYVEQFTLHASMPEINHWYQARYSPHKNEVEAERYTIEGPPPPTRPLVFMRKEPPFSNLAKAGLLQTPTAWCADERAAIKSVKDRLAALKAEPTP